MPLGLLVILLTLIGKTGRATAPTAYEVAYQSAFSEISPVPCGMMFRLGTHAASIEHGGADDRNGDHAHDDPVLCAEVLPEYGEQLFQRPCPTGVSSAKMAVA